MLSAFYSTKLLFKWFIIQKLAINKQSVFVEDQLAMPSFELRMERIAASLQAFEKRSISLLFGNLTIVRVSYTAKNAAWQAGSTALLQDALQNYDSIKFNP